MSCKFSLASNPISCRTTINPLYSSPCLRAHNKHPFRYCNNHNIIITNLVQYIHFHWFECTEVFWLVVQKSRRESAHARTLDGHFELKIMRMRGFSSRFLDNQPENLSTQTLKLHSYSLSMPGAWKQVLIRILFSRNTVFSH